MSESTETRYEIETSRRKSMFRTPKIDFYMVAGMREELRMVMRWYLESEFSRGSGFAVVFEIDK